MLKSSVKILFCLIVCIFSTQVPGISHAQLAPYEKTTNVRDVVIGGLNVRTGPGFSYPVIAQVSYGEDVVSYCPTTPNGCAPVSGNGQEWTRNYYPDGNIGYYSNAAVGYTAWYISAEQGPFNYVDTHTTKVVRSSTLYRDACPNLGGSSGITEPKGKYLPAYDDELKATVCNPNAWRVLDTDYHTDGYVNGWNLKAE
ncbi:hypothetical protein PPM_p0287 (plasmid) [Paenibacillus polymyxa M1]|uniref:SH3 domain-containing protein n=1 Tax=Paenibacillus polymyxa TaxID=1406 RepID=UPI00021BBAA9|nr:SH3 domain-containing protein [Paenibacillus polymyxa]CCC86437.1 hypothetical protein PPM_p0287 [Paenibacillus polymyxa M1]